jgi:hypothetical protein
MRHVGLWFSFVLVLGFCAPAFAQLPPAGCATDAKSPYHAGYVASQSLINTAWKRVNQCSDTVLDDFAKNKVGVVLKLYLPKPGYDDLIRCRFAGSYAGIQDAMQNILAGCADQCNFDGQIAGDIAAQAYCLLSIALGGLADADQFLRGPVQVCGLSFEFGCDSQFLTTAAAFSGCAPYTQAAFRAVFEQTQFNQCAYDPIDPNDPNP